jgi:predicted acyltransferase
VLQQKTNKQQILQLLGVGIVLLGIGLSWSNWHPINKGLWTGSFVLVSSAAACFSLALIILLWRVPGIKTALDGLKIYGSNPIFIYVAAWLFSVFLNRFTLTIGEQSNSLQGWIYSHFQSMMTDKLASLLFATLFTVLFYFIALVLYKKRIFIKL